MPRLDETAKGVYLITVTPFRDDGALDLESTDRLTDFYLGCGVTGFTVLGVMGEAPKLTAEESRTYVKRVARAGGRPRARDRGRLLAGLRGDGGDGVNFTLNIRENKHQFFKPKWRVTINISPLRIAG